MTNQGMALDKLPSDATPNTLKSLKDNQVEALSTYTRLFSAAVLALTIS